VQQLGLGLAALLAGALVSQASPGQPLERYPLVGLLACTMAVLSFCLAGAVRPVSAITRRTPPPDGGTVATLPALSSSVGVPPPWELSATRVLTSGGGDGETAEVAAGIAADREPVSPGR
jgi:hypothetical protein